MRGVTLKVFPVLVTATEQNVWGEGRVVSCVGDSN
jgi:hypothetical protein